MKQTMVFDMQGRGTMTVQRALWQYVRCGDFELATPRLHFPEPGPRSTTRRRGPRSPRGCATRPA